MKPFKSIREGNSVEPGVSEINDVPEDPLSYVEIKPKKTKVVKEASELGDLAHQTTLKHRFLVTYSDPNHTMVSKRKEHQQKHVLVPSTKDGQTVYTGDAEPLVKKYMKKQGYKVHNVEHIGMVSKKVNEEWVQTGKTATHTSGEKTFEWAKVDDKGNRTGERHYRNASGKVMGEETNMLEEAVSVKKEKHSWGTMMTVHHGSDTSYPLHPEHQSAIKKLRPGMKTTFKDETNSTVHAHREGDTVHLTRPKTSSTLTSLPYHHFDTSEHGKATPRKPAGEYERKVTAHLKKKYNEEAEQIDELKTGTLLRYHTKAGKSGLQASIKGSNAMDTGNTADAMTHYKKSEKRMKGQAQAMGKIQKRYATEGVDILGIWESLKPEPVVETFDTEAHKKELDRLMTKSINAHTETTRLIKAKASQEDINKAQERHNAVKAEIRTHKDKAPKGPAPKPGSAAHYYASKKPGEYTGD